MSIDISLSKTYWNDFQVTDQDIEFLYSCLLENETPQTSFELITSLVSKRIKDEIENMEKTQAERGSLYLPKETYTVGTKLVFPAMDWKSGKIVNIRDGVNPDIAPFKVIDVKFDDDSVKSFASQYEDHILNQPLPLAGPDENLDTNFVLSKYRNVLSQKLESKLKDNDELVQIAGRWFPRSLLVDVNIGYLNLAEALLDEKGGGPLSTSTILQSIELPTDTNIKLTEFSLNYALQEDERFDEVGPTGEVLWYLHRLEPEAVLNQPPQLKYGALEYDYSSAIPYLKQFSQNIVDELEPLLEKETSTKANEAVIAILYPHWRSGTLPLAANISNLIPSAYEAPRVLFTFVDGNTGKTFGGWVVRSQHYIYGLSQWYEENEIIPGSLIQIKKGNKPGEVIITVQKKRPTKEYIHTTLVGADGGVVFALLKQNVSTIIDERMAIAVPDPEALDKVWQQSRGGKPALEKTLHQVMNNMIKLSPQGNVHAEELYAALNTVRRCPPALMLSILLEKPWAKHLGDLYFRIDESATIGGNDE